MLCKPALMYLLILERPGVGKTTAMRDLARVLSDELCKRVVS